MLKLLVFIIGFTVASCAHVHFYRRDYTFIEDFDAYYKLHWDPHGISWNSAFMACDDEGAKLFYPKLDGEWTVAKKLLQSLSTKPNVSEIYVGIHDEFGLGEYITVDGVTTPSPLGDAVIVADGEHCVIMDIETGVNSTDSCTTELDAVRPFICKKIDDKPCPTIDRGYIYKKEAKKCYKLNENPKSWQEAVHTCYLEGGMLTVLENNIEANAVKEMITQSSSEKFFTGFRKIFSNGDFYTIKGNKLNKSGYVFRNDRDDQLRDCGIILSGYNALFSATDNCQINLPFVCEMQPKLL